MKKIFTSLLLLSMGTAALAQWSPTQMHGERIRATSNVKKFYTLDLQKLRADLAKAEPTGRNAKAVEISLPTLDGKVERFAVYSAPVVVKSLADRYQLGSYVGVGIDDPTASVRFSVAPNDFQSMMFRNGAYEFIEPQDQNKTVYGVHPKTNKSEADKAFVCSTSEAPLTKQQIDKMYMSGQSFGKNNLDVNKSSDQKYRTMRLAMSVTGEYTQYFGGVEGAMTQINATLTRCNGVFEKDFALHLILQDFPQLIYTDPASDPYSPASSGAGGSWNLELQRNLTNTIGSAAYDIGHLFGATGGGGNAGCIGCVCVDPVTSSSKAKGSAFTSPADGIPMGDNFDIDYVAHEIGHQLGANHTFSMSLEGSGQNVEPGSGSTVMSYAGITGATDVQPHSDGYFHINSIIQVQNNLNSKTCDIETAVANTPPEITPMLDVSIPKGTAFVLTAQVTDAENDALTYNWEQVDNASVTISKANLGNTTSGASFRSMMPSNSPTRYFPRLSSVLAGKLSDPANWEAVSSVARTSTFRITVRDNNADPKQQQTQQALQKVTVVNSDPFKVTNTKVYNNAPSAVNWNVVGTDQAPFNVQNVKIDYTTDEGATWTVLKASTPNDGTEDVDFSTFAADTQLKLRVSAIGNVFYAVAPVIVSKIVSCDGSAPVGLTATTVQIESAVVVWDPVLDATYKLRYKKASESSWTEVDLSATTYTLENLEEGTAYVVEVAAVCTGTVGAYASLEFTTKGLEYCTLVSGSAKDEFIKRVQITAQGAAGGDSGTTGASTYTDYSSDSTKVMMLAKGTTENTITVTKAWTSTQYNEGVTAWIDFNRNGIYEANELVMSTTANKETPVTATFTVPEDAYTGDKPLGMRVALRYNAAQTNPCGTFSYGEVEDYAVMISATLGVNDQVKNNGISVYPNPAVDVLNVTKVSDRATYTIYNMAGQAVAKGNVADNKVQVSKLQKGVYIISVDNNGETAKVKFIKK